MLLYNLSTQHWYFSISAEHIGYLGLWRRRTAFSATQGDSSYHTQVFCFFRRYEAQIQISWFLVSATAKGEEIQLTIYRVSGLDQRDHDVTTIIRTFTRKRLIYLPSSIFRSLSSLSQTALASSIFFSAILYSP